MHDSEKVETPSSEKQEVVSSSSGTDAVLVADAEKSLPVDEIDPAKEAQLVRKLDMYLLPQLALFYLLSFLDRVNIGNANAARLSEDLNLSGAQFSGCVSIFFAGYVLFEVPSNLVVKKIGPARWLPFIMAIWSIITICQAAAKDFGSLFACRFFLGVAEAGLVPGILLFLTMFYKRKEMARRVTLYFSAGTFAGAFGGFIAYGIQTTLEGRHGYRAWQWIFIIEGVMSLGIALIAFFTFPSFPSTAPFLTPEERELAVKRLKIADSLYRAQDEFRSYHIRYALFDLKTWIYSFMFLFHAIPLYAISYFLPTIIKTMGAFDPLMTNLMSALPYLVACVVTIIVGFLSDRFGERGIHMVTPLWVTFFAYIALACYGSDPAKQYAAVFFVAAGLFSATPPLLSWFSNNFAGHYKKAVAQAIIVSVGNIGGVISGQIYTKDDAPLYHRGHGLSALFIGLMALLGMALKFMLWRENKRRANLPPEQRKQIIDADSDLGDKHPDFRYIH
ncbi:uncharacterized protein VTP21DRAFT_3156 [Calcarisporiella thermophila]|uniref:uncharacterized protein n=1 Tax=Calcarisporiella thermophila TaxID=911321 RepID=UPI0037433D41